MFDFQIDVTFVAFNSWLMPCMILTLLLHRQLGALAAEATKIASAYSDVLSATILNEEQCKELNMGSYLGVAAASANPPHFIHLCYKPPTGPVSTKLGLVGKGLTFDRCLYICPDDNFP